MKLNRFELEQQFMECWHITSDIETVIKSIDNMEIEATDKDTLLNMLIGLRTLYDYRFAQTLDTFGELVKKKVILNPTQHV